MPVKRDKKIFFIHNPRTGGRSIERFLDIPIQNHEKNKKNFLLGPQKNGECPVQHLTIEQLLEKEYITREEIDSYFVFSVVRNPYKRLISAYQFGPHRSKVSFKEFVSMIYKKNEKNELINQADGTGNHFLQQYRFMYIGNENICDYIGYNENFKDIEKKLREKTKTKKKMPFVGNGDKKNLNNFFDNESLKMTNEIYDLDFETFGYKKIYKL